MTADPSSEIHRRLRDAEQSLQNCTQHLSDWDDAAAARTRPDIDEVADSLDKISGLTTELLRTCDEAASLADLARSHSEAATAGLTSADGALQEVQRELVETETALRGGEQAARESGHLITQALQALSKAGAPCGLATGVGALEGEVAGGVRDVRIARVRRMAAKAAAQAVATEAAWAAAERLAGAGAERLTGLDKVEFGDAWGTLRTTVEDFGPVTTARIRAWLDGLRPE